MTNEPSPASLWQKTLLLVVLSSSPRGGRRMTKMPQKLALHLFPRSGSAPLDFFHFLGILVAVEQ